MTGTGRVATVPVSHDNLMCQLNKATLMHAYHTA